MLVYNITTFVEQKIHDDWLVWIKEHIRDVLSTGCFTSATLCQIENPEDDGERAYAVQFKANDKESFDRYQKEHAPGLRLESQRLFGDQALSIRSELTILEEFTSED